MPMITSRSAAKILAILLPGLASVVSGAAEQQDAHATTNFTHNSQSEGSQGHPKGQLCLVGSRNCLNVDGHPPRLCLLAPHQCDGDAGRLERLELVR
jgi:hypothetical protein